MGALLATFVIDTEHERSVIFRCDTSAFCSVRIFELNSRCNTSSAFHSPTVHKRVGKRSRDHDALFPLLIEDNQLVQTNSVADGSGIGRCPKKDYHPQSYSHHPAEKGDPERPL